VVKYLAPRYICYETLSAEADTNNSIFFIRMRGVLYSEIDGATSFN